MRDPHLRARVADAAREHRQDQERQRPVPPRWREEPIEPPGHPIMVAVRKAETEPSWPAPKPLPDGLLPVAAFEMDFLPKSIAPWVADISDRMQCPADFVGIPAMVALGAVLGRRVGIRPQQMTDWTEVANLWGCIVGRPGAMKSPAAQEALRPLNRIEADARKESDEARKDYESALTLHKIAKEVATAKAREALRKGDNAEGLLDIDEPEEPKAKRLVTNDTSYERLGEILADNPNGVLAFRDELVSLLKTLDREEYAAARGFYLTAWNGTSGYTFDRITRGKTHIEAACVSLLGSTQPGKIAEYIRRATSGGAGDDGLIQRFSLLVWPDQAGDWKEQDRYPLIEAKQAAWATFGSIGSLDPMAIGAQRDDNEELPYLRFDDAAQQVFREWRADLEKRLRSGDMSPAMESHMAKFRKTVPALALINHLADGGCGPVNERAILRALAFSQYLETHARRAYAAGSEGETTAAKAIISRIRRRQLSDGFTARELWRNKWSGLDDLDHVKAGLALLTDYHWLSLAVAQTGGRPSGTYTINPKVLA